MCGRNSRAQYVVLKYIDRPLIAKGSTGAKDCDCWRHWIANRWYTNDKRFSDTCILTENIATVNEMGSEESFQNITVLQEINQ